MRTPKISIVVIYNSESNLDACIQSIVNQSFSNIEIICVSNGANDIAQNIVKKESEKTAIIKRLSIPMGGSIQTVKRSGLAFCEGEFVIFIENNEIISSDFIKNFYMQIQEEKNIEIENKHLYRRSFLENDKEISSLINDKVEVAIVRYSDFIRTQEQMIKEEYSKINKNMIESIDNRTFNIISRFNALENEVYSKHNENLEKISEIENTLKTLTKINELIEDTRLLKDKIDTLEKEIYTRYVDLKRIMDVQFDKIKDRLG